METCLWVIIPCYNEEAVLLSTAPLFLAELLEMRNRGVIADRSRILFVNDGSTDQTWRIIQNLAAEDEHYIGICQSRNRGHQNAVLAGLMEAKNHCDITISIDCDGQDDIHAMARMVDAYHEGCDIVYGVRNNRASDTWFKRNTAQIFYKLLNKMGAEVVYNHADYRLVDAKVLQNFAEFKEVNIYLRGMFPLVGFKSTSVYYERHERIAGRSHYPLRKMIGLAVDGITSLSIKPIEMIAKLGMMISLIGLLGIIWVVVNALLGKTLTGWASLVCIIVFLGGIQLISLGIIGEYVGKTYMETKHRPRYIISERAGMWYKNCQKMDRDDRDSEKNSNGELAYNDESSHGL